MGYAPGDRVHLRGLGTGTIVETRGASRYAIDIKGRVVIAKDSDLELAELPHLARTRAAQDRRPSPKPSARGPAPSLDLHGVTAAEAEALVVQFVNDTLLAGHGEARIIHGKGGGRVKAAVHRSLRHVSSVASFRIDPRNEGVTIVSFA